MPGSELLNSFKMPPGMPKTVKYYEKSILRYSLSRSLVKILPIRRKLRAITFSTACHMKSSLLGNVLFKDFRQDVALSFLLLSLQQLFVQMN